MHPPSDPEQGDLYRREALGAFAHEVRTPLTSIKMVMELARRQSTEGGLLMDDELAGMLRTSVDDLQSLADDLQETSRLERGRLNLSPGPCELSAAVEAARDLLRGIEITGSVEPGIDGPWDAARLVRAIAGFAESANRIGDGSGSVVLDLSVRAASVELAFCSGKPGGEERPIAADAGFSFFRSRQLVLAMGGSVHCQRAERYATFRVALPLGVPGDTR
jgi:signal transduction histidine kinase